MFLGLDIGTSVIKAALFDANGKECATETHRMQFLTAPLGWSELDGEAVWLAAAAVVQALLTNTAHSASQVRGVGVTGVMVGAWLVDERGELVRPPILWNDARAQAFIDARIAQEPALISRVFDHSGSVMQLGCTMPVLAWLKANEPHNLNRAKHVLCAKDFIRFRLTGVPVTDESEAAMAPGSAITRSFHRDPMALLDIEELSRLLVPVARAETLSGFITAEAAAQTGLVIGTPVAVGTGDTGSCVIGAGAHLPGQATTVLGTTCLNGVLFDRPVFEPRDLGLLFIVPGQLWMKTMVNVAGTTVLDWCLSTLCPDIAVADQPYDALGSLAETSTAGANGVVFVPYLSATGIIAPHIESRARAGFHGLAPHHGRADLVRAVYEGMAYAIRDCYDAIGGTSGTIRLSGGGARSSFWSQIIADITGYIVEIPDGTQFGAKGAALCAAVAVGDYASLADACAATFSAKRTHMPNPAFRKSYDAGFRRFKTASAAALSVLTGVVD